MRHNVRLNAARPGYVRHARIGARVALHKLAVENRHAQRPLLGMVHSAHARIGARVLNSDATAARLLCGMR